MITSETSLIVKWIWLNGYRMVERGFVWLVLIVVHNYIVVFNIVNPFMIVTNQY